MDLSVFGKAGSIPEAMQQIAAQKQAMQTAKLDQLSKQNIYATQVLAGATATGDQNAYDAARQHLANNGVDVSTWAPDVKTAGQQVTAARQAQYTQNPLFPLLNAGLKQESNDLQRAAQTNQLPTQGLNIGGVPLNNVIGGVAPQNPAQWKNPDQPPINTQVNAAPETPLQKNNIVIPAAQQNTTSNSFSPPPQMPNETFPGYMKRVEQAFQIYKEKPDVLRAREGALDAAKVDVSRQANKTKAEGALNGFEQQVGLVTDNIDKALNSINGYSTGYGSLLSSLPNTDARKLRNYLDTIKANIGFDKLQNMRENSPTGGALGQVSDMENRLLQAVNGSLDPGIPEQLKEDLSVIKELYPQVLKEKQRAFQQDYGNVEPIGNNPQPQIGNAKPITEGKNVIRTATESADPYQKARDAIKAGAPRLQVEKRLLESGLDPRKL